MQPRGTLTLPAQRRHFFAAASREPSAVVSISIDDGEEGYPERKERFERAGRQIIVPVEDIRSHRTVIIRF